jgi:hypothetical protein
MSDLAIHREINDIEREVHDAVDLVVAQGATRNDVHRIVYWAEHLGQVKAEYILLGDGAA